MNKLQMYGFFKYILFLELARWMCTVNIFERKTLCDMKLTFYVVFWDNIYSNISKIMFLNKVDIPKPHL